MQPKNLKEILLAMSEFHTGSEKDACAAIAAIYDGGMMIVDQMPLSASKAWAAEILSKHNKWRRGDDSIDPTHPVDLGKAIDIAIKCLDQSNGGLK